MSVKTRELPSGTVTFVFTDIEGSTRLVRRLGDRYGDELDRHRTLLRSAWRDHRGHELGTEGDSFFVAFGSCDEAVAACVQGQRLLDSETWLEHGELRVRMGVHAGLAYPRGNDYISLAVHQAARVMSVAHGGQVLVSAAVAHRLASTDDFELVALGRFRVRDFDEPVELYRTHTRDRPAVIRSPRAIPADGHNLSTPSTALLGRGVELAELRGLVRAGGLVTLVGPGGVGKTRLLIEFGLQQTGEWPDGSWLVRLDALEAPELIPGAIAEAVGAASAPGVDVWQEVLDYLRARRALVLFDNCEHLLEASAFYVSRLLDHCPGVAVVATSREPTGLHGESVLRLGPLSASVASGPSPAVELFLERVESGSFPTDVTADLEAIAALCQRLDGLPLAIELAAARANVLSPAEILRALDDRAQILRSRDQSVPERQRTLEDLLDWGYGLLAPQERMVLRQLSLFAKSFDLPTAELTCATTGTDVDVAELVWSLVSKSLVVTELLEGSTRYRLLRTVRDYARRRLEGPEEAAATRRLAEHYAEQVGPDRQMDRSWVGEVAVELDNIRAVASPTSLLAEPMRQRLAWSIGRYHDVTDAFATGIEEIGRYVDILPTPSSDLVALLTLLADFHLRVGDIDGARRNLERAKSIRVIAGSPEWDDGGVVRTEGEIALREHDLPRARQLGEDALARGLSARGRARMWNLLGLTLVALEELDGALDAFEHELKGWTELGQETFSATTLGNLAEVSLRLERHADAAQHQLACLELASALGQPVLVAFSMITAAHLTASDSKWALSVELHTAADVMLEESGYVMYDSDREARDEFLRAAGEHLDDVELGDAVRRGTAMEMVEAVSATSGVLRSMK